MMMILQKAGGLRSGSDRRGNIWHAVDYENRYAGPALCGQTPRIQWSIREGDAVTCESCLKKMQQ